jgi:hypothetical protein
LESSTDCVNIHLEFVYGPSNSNKIISK